MDHMTLLKATGLLIAAGIFAGSAQTSTAKTSRAAEVLRMDQPAALASSGDNDVDMAERLKGFLLLDLGRNGVGDTMRADFSEIALRADEAAIVSPLPDERPVLAPYSSIAVPGWMRAPQLSALPVASARFVPGCVMVPYRPAGFLPLHVESRRRGAYDAMSAAACEAGIPVGLFDALVMSESAYNPGAVSPKNAFGYAQLMPGTAAGLGVNRYDPLDNLRGGARYLRAHLDSFGQVPLALAAYNAGPGRVKGGRIPAIPETQGYVREVLDKWARLAGQQRIVAVTSFDQPDPSPVTEVRVSHRASVQSF